MANKNNIERLNTTHQLLNTPTMKLVDTDQDLVEKARAQLDALVETMLLLHKRSIILGMGIDNGDGPDRVPTVVSFQANKRLANFALPQPQQPQGR